MPKRVPLDLVVPGTPEQVAKALKEDTVFRPFPSGGAGPLRISKKPLGGRVSQAGINVSLYEPSWINMIQPVARAKLSATPGGTRVQGDVGLHAWVTNYLRLATVLLLAGAGTVGVGAATSAPVVGGLVAVLAFLLVSVISIGANVAHADDRVDDLTAQVHESLKGAGVALARSLGEADPDALRAAESEVEDLARAPERRTPEGPGGS